VLPVAGGGPPYPTDYVRDGRAGEVAVDCTIDPDGEPEHCRVRDVFGGRRFAEATVDWLNSGTVRFRPALRGGVPVAEERRWRIAFPPRR
jgi:TonB family protein